LKGKAAADLLHIAAARLIKSIAQVWLDGEALRGRWRGREEGRMKKLVGHAKRGINERISPRIF